MAGRIRIGISGWRYDGWRGAFYPEDLVQRRELEYASSKLSSIEINGSFYSLQRPESYARWRDETPRDFVFSVKAPKFITHVRKLRDVETPIANFFASGVLALEAKLGPILWQFAPSFRFDAELFETFLGMLPSNTEEALGLARGCDAWMRDRACLATDAKRPVRHAVEIRNASFANASFVELLRRHGVALVVADAPAKWPYLEDVTADFLYLRLHGADVIYESGYTDEALTRWAGRIRAWSEGTEPEDAHRVAGRAPRPRKSRDVYCYFDNDAKARAPADAQTLMRKLDLSWRASRYHPAEEADAARGTKRAKGALRGDGATGRGGLALPVVRLERGTRRRAGRDVRALRGVGSDPRSTSRRA